MSADGGQGQLFQNSLYVGNIFMGILYGVELMLYLETLLLLRRRHGSHKFLMFFITVLLFLITVLVMGEGLLAQEMWVVHQDWPGGPAAYYREYVSVWYQTWATASWILLEIMSNAVSIHRCWMVWCGNWRVIFVPCLLWLVTVAAGILELYVSGSPNANFFAGLAARIGIIYFTLSIGLSVLTTCLILGQILRHAWTIRNSLGDDFASTYFTISSVMVESALPYTLTGVAFLVAFGMESDFSILLVSIYAMFTCISPQLLILRFAQGKTWTRNTLTANQPLTSIAFAGPELDRLKPPVGSVTTQFTLDSMQNEGPKSGPMWSAV